MRKRRVMAKAKVYGFSPWVDQVDAINQIMKETGEKTESVLLRKLVDEALEARRTKSVSTPLSEESVDGSGRRLENIEALLMRLVQQGDVSFRIQDVCFALLQEVLAEAYATHRILWEFGAAPRLRDEGMDGKELERRFKLRVDEAKHYAYHLTEGIRQSQESFE
jgi:hypothetical protein